MSIIKDIEEAKKLWGDASLPIKGIIVVSLFITVSSVASLSELVFRWKGFFLDALEFYRKWVVIPIVDFFKPFDIVWSRAEADVVILGWITVVSWVRYCWVDCSLTQAGKKDFKDFFLGIAGYIIGYAGAVYNFSGASNQAGSWTLLIYIAVFLFLLFFLKGRNRIIFGAPLVIAVIIVLLLGAINAGLTRIA